MNGKLIITAFSNTQNVSLPAKGTSSPFLPTVLLKTKKRGLPPLPVFRYNTPLWRQQEIFRL